MAAVFVYDEALESLGEGYLPIIVTVEHGEVVCVAWYQYEVTEAAYSVGIEDEELVEHIVNCHHHAAKLANE